MANFAKRVGDLVASNVDHLLDRATDPAKMIARLQREVEETIIAVSRDRAAAERRQKAIEEERTRIELLIEGWREKAGIAMDHRREDLARQALMAREETEIAAARLILDAEAIRDEIGTMDEALSDLEAKREELCTQQSSAAGSGSAMTSGGDSSIERRMDRLAGLEQRTRFAAPNASESGPDREIETIRRDKRIDEELAALRGASD